MRLYSFKPRPIASLDPLQLCPPPLPPSTLPILVFSIWVTPPSRRVCDCVLSPVLPDPPPAFSPLLTTAWGVGGRGCWVEWGSQLLGLEPGITLLSAGRLWQLVTCISSLPPCPVHVHHPPIRLTVLPPPVAQVSRGFTATGGYQGDSQPDALHGETDAWDPDLLLCLVAPSVCIIIFSIFRLKCRLCLSPSCQLMEQLQRFRVDFAPPRPVCPTMCESPPLRVRRVSCLLFKQRRDARRLLSDSLAALLPAPPSAVRP